VRVRHWLDKDWVVATRVETSTSGLVPTAFLTRTLMLDDLLSKCAEGSTPSALMSIDALVAGDTSGEPTTTTTGDSTLTSCVCDNQSSHDTELALTYGAEVTPRRWVDRRWVVCTASDGSTGIVPAAILVPDPSSILPFVNPISAER
jgi:hypothetical protein